MTDQARGLDRRAQLLPSITRPNRAPQAQAPGREVHTDSGDDAAPSRVGCPLPRLPQSADVARCRCDRSAAVRPAAVMAPPLRRSRSAGRCPKPALLTAHCKTRRTGSKMPVRPRMEGWPISLPTDDARCCSTPGAATTVGWLLCANSGSLAEAAAWATLQLPRLSVAEFCRPDC